MAWKINFESGKTRKLFRAKISNECSKCHSIGTTTPSGRAGHFPLPFLNGSVYFKIRLDPDYAIFESQIQSAGASCQADFKGKDFYGCKVMEWNLPPR
jgi:hypothetical protein